MKPSRPRTDEQLVEIVRQAMLGKTRASFCPVCGLGGFEEMTQDHPFGEGWATEYLGAECNNCGRMFPCKTCGGWHVERWLGEETPEDCKPYLCDCPPPSSATCSPGTLWSDQEMFHGELEVLRQEGSEGPPPSDA